MKQFIKWFVVLLSCLFNAELCLNAQPKITNVEYYIDIDYGYGLNKPISVSQGVDLSNLQVKLNPDTLSAGVHIFGIRAKDVKGVWSLDNKCLFVVQKPAAAVPDLKAVEFYIDNDPGYGKGTPIAINSVRNLPNFDLPVNISALKTGSHVLYIRSKDANDAWSLDNVDSFNIPAVINPATIVINSVTSTTVCTGGNFRISFQANGSYDSTNVFKVQLSNKNGSFSNAKTIGTKKSRTDAIISCTIPPNTQGGSNYLLRVISTSHADTGLISTDTLTIKATPAKPVITSLPDSTTGLCPGTKVTLTSSAVNYNFWNTGDTTQSIVVDSAASYYVTVTNSNGCSNTSDSAVITYLTCAKPAGPKTKDITSSGATLLWKSVPCKVKYKVQYRIAGTQTYTTVNTTDTFYVLNDLSSSVSYEWRVQTVCNTSPLINSTYTQLTGFTTAASLVTAIVDDDQIQELNDVFNATIIPNPAINEAVIYIQTNHGKNISISLSDVTGKILWSGECVADNRIQLPVNSISNGVYFVTVTDGLDKKTLKFVKQK